MNRYLCITNQLDKTHHLESSPGPAVFFHPKKKRIPKESKKGTLLGKTVWLPNEEAIAIPDKNRESPRHNQFFFNSIHQTIVTFTHHECWSFHGEVIGRSPQFPQFTGCPSGKTREFLQLLAPEPWKSNHHYSVRLVETPTTKIF